MIQDQSFWTAFAFIIAPVAALILGISITAYLYHRWIKPPAEEVQPPPPGMSLEQAMEMLIGLMGKQSEQIVNPLQQVIQSLPNQVLKSIQGNLNTLKGTAAEHISYLQLKATYDRLISFGSIADFIGIRFPRGEDEGVIHFIDIKTGKARLSKDQTMFRQLIEAKHIGFITIKVEMEEGRQACHLEAVEG